MLAHRADPGWPGGPARRRNRCLLLFGFAGALRRSEAAAIDLADLEFSDEAGLHVRLPSSKTDQEGLGDVIAVPFGSDPLTCPVCGDHSYWHHRTSGGDAGAMVLTEFIPLLADHGLDTDRVAFLGWSMGGYGALWLGGQLGRPTTAAVVAESPAIWHHAADTPPGAFDDEQDFTQHSVFGRQSQLTGVAVRLDCGTGDGFYPTARDYARSLTPHPAGGFQPGAHNLAYWRRMAPTQLQFISQHLPTTHS